MRYVCNLKYLLVIFFISSLVFVFFPDIDLAVSKLFYNGNKFPLNNTLFDYIFYYSIKPIIILISIVSIVIFLYNTFNKKNLFNITKRNILYLLLILSIGPGLIVNATLKENWGRARPLQTIEFGGNKTFTPAFVISNQDGYSFSSGHAAAAFSLVGISLLMRKRKKTLFTITFIYAIFVSISRIAVGGHFLSDVITSFFIVCISTSFFYKLLIEKDI